MEYSKELLEKYGKPTAKGMVEAGLRHIKILEDLDFYDIALSLKASSLDLCIESYREAANTIDYPLHLGVTHAGTEFSGTISSSIGLGTLLREGIGNTMRVSLSADPVKEVKIGKIRIGGNNPIAIQSMTNTSPHDFEATFKQSNLLEKAGCEIE